MGKRWFFIIAIPFVISCFSMIDGWKELNLGSFKISVPSEWHYKKAQGKDSFVGYIVGPRSLFSFDYSKDGYAGDVIPSGNILDIKKTYHIKIETTEKYIIKTIWPIISEKGNTGIYFKSRHSDLNFNLIAGNLPKHEQELALQVFKTIKLKD